MHLYQIDCNHIGGSILPPSSKSISHRCLFLGALSETPLQIEDVATGNDIQETITILQTLGVEIQKQHNTIIIRNPTGFIKNAEYHIHESGTTYRFLLPLLAALGVGGTIYVDERLGNRPILPLLSTLSEHGIAFDIRQNCLTITGKLTPGYFTLDTSLSSQFASGLLMGLACLTGDGIVKSVGEIVSFPYLQMTINLLRSCGVPVSFQENTWTVTGKGYLSAPKHISVEKDWSQAAVWLCIGALTGNVTVSGLSRLSTQGDKTILTYLKHFGSETLWDNDKLTMTKIRRPIPVQADISPTPDLFPVLAVMAGLADGTSIFHGVKRLTGKESNRLEGTVKMLHTLGVSSHLSEDNNTLTINGVPYFTPNNHIFCQNDHRLAMASCLASVKCQTPLTIEDKDCVQKSYPSFWQDAESIGIFIHPGTT